MHNLTREQVRRVDRLAIDELGISGVVLMENAGRNAAAVILSLLRNDVKQKLTGTRAVVLCGGGNNGGAGYVIARILQGAGAAVEIFAARDPRGDAAIHAEMSRPSAVPVRSMMNDAAVDRVAGDWADTTVIVDALLGAGFSGELRKPMRRAIERCNATRRDDGTGPLVVAIDVPSGMDCDTGRPAVAGGIVIRADVTVTFVAPKVGFAEPEVQALLGRVVVADIGVPPELVDRAAGEASRVGAGARRPGDRAMDDG